MARRDGPEAVHHSVPLDLVPSEETQGRLPGIAGGLSVALARAFRVVDPKLPNPHTNDWERAFRLFDLLL
jgi:hypothetical protein